MLSDINIIFLDEYLFYITNKIKLVTDHIFEVRVFEAL